MPGGARFEVPADLADELIAEGTSVRSYTTRGGGVADVVHIALAVVNTGADVVTVATAAAAMPAFVRRLVAYIRRKRGGRLGEVVLRSDSRETAIELPEGVSNAEAERILRAGIERLHGDCDR